VWYRSKSGLGIFLYLAQSKIINFKSLNRALDNEWAGAVSIRQQFAIIQMDRVSSVCVDAAPATSTLQFQKDFISKKQI
jgi:hypothetical protein